MANNTDLFEDYPGQYIDGPDEEPIPDEPVTDELPNEFFVDPDNYGAQFD